MARHNCETKFWPVGYVTAAEVSREGPYRDLLLLTGMAARSQNRDDLGKEDAMRGG